MYIHRQENESTSVYRIRVYLRILKFLPSKEYSEISSAIYVVLSVL